jgi:hypothetical protein
MPDLAPLIEFGKLFGFPALCLAVVAVMAWRGLSWCGRELLKPTVDDLRSAFRLAGPAAVQMRDDVAEVKETTARMERRQIEHLEVCAGPRGLTADERGKPGLAPLSGKTAPA